MGKSGIGQASRVVAIWILAEYFLKMMVVESTM